MKKEEVKSFYRALRDTDLATMETLVREYIGKRVSPITILNEGMIGAMGIIGQEFEVLLVARNMNK
jgi:methanogenic corrinoid protein MtbC1